MKPHARRRLGLADYYKLATWDDGMSCYRDGKRGYPSEADAVAAAPTGTLCRVSHVTSTGRQDLPPFTKD